MRLRIAVLCATVGLVAFDRVTATASCSAPSPFRLLTLRKSCRPEKRRGAGGEKRDLSFAPAGPWSRSASRRAGAHEPALHGVTATAVCSTLFGSGVALAPGGVASRSRGAFTSARRRPVCRSSSASAGEARPSASVSDAGVEYEMPLVASGKHGSHEEKVRDPAPGVRRLAQRLDEEPRVL